jgi:organic radical activating enzyme
MKTISTLPPSFILDLHAICNQQCPYCVARDPWDGTFGPLAETRERAKVERFFMDHGPFNVILTGGEPMITPHIEPFLQLLLDACHTVSLQTNLRFGIDIFQRTVPPERTGWILTTLHSVAQPHSQEFAVKARNLRQAGYPVVAKLVLDQPTLDRLEELYDLLEKTGTGVLLSPLVVPEASPDEMPVMQYSQTDWKRIAPRINLLSAWLFFAGGFRSRGKICHAGCRSFYGRLGNHGYITGCAHSHPENLGNLFKNEFVPASGPIHCGLDRCCCDFNTYTGIVDGLDDREGFDRLRKGENHPVSMENFLAWSQGILISRLDFLKGMTEKKSKEGTVV